MKRWIDEQLGDVVADCCGGQAGFYFYLTFKEIQTTEGSPFFKFLARTTGRADVDGSGEDKNPRVIYVPGEFCVHPKGELVEIGRRQLRLSYGFEELGRIERALKMVREAADYARHL